MHPPQRFLPPSYTREYSTGNPQYQNRIHIHTQTQAQTRNQMSAQLAAAAQSVIGHIVKRLNRKW